MTVHVYRGAVIPRAAWHRHDGCILGSAGTVPIGGVYAPAGVPARKKILLLVRWPNILPLEAKWSDADGAIRFDDLPEITPPARYADESPYILIGQDEDGFYKTVAAFDAAFARY